MELLIWGGIFIVALAALIKGADWVLDSSQKIGLALGMSPFLVGVVIVGFGTSLPELASSIFGMLRGATEIPVANTVGSNIANILLIIGLSAIFAKGTLGATKKLIDIEIPLLLLSTFFFIGVAYDGAISLIESLFLLVGFFVYLAYSLVHKDGEYVASEEAAQKPKVTLATLLLLIVGFAFLIGGAKYLIDAVLAVSALAGIPVGIITVLAVAVGTSLPELLVSIKAAVNNNPELSLGNIFGSNIFNILFIVGASGLFGTMTIDEATFTIALPTFVATTLFLVVSGISNKIHTWEGVFFVLVYALFVVKLFGIA